MDGLLTLYEFLLGILPADLTAKALALAPVVVAIVGLLRLIPWFAARKRVTAPLAALVLGQGFGYAAVGFDGSQMLLGAGAGLVITLAAIGGFSTVKNVVQAAGNGVSQADAPRQSAKVLPEQPWPRPPGTGADPTENRTRTTSRR